MISECPENYDYSTLCEFCGDEFATESTDALLDVISSHIVLEHSDEEDEGYLNACCIEWTGDSLDESWDEDSN